MELLRTRVAVPANPDGPQIIILSHDGLLEKYFDTNASKGNWNHQRLLGRPPRGSVTSERQGINRIRDAAEKFLNAGQIREAELLVRQYLEFHLLRLINKVDIRVPLDFSIRDDRKMVKNCLDAINESMNLHKDAGRLILDSSQVQAISNIHVPAIIANWLSHGSCSICALAHA